MFSFSSDSGYDAQQSRITTPSIVVLLGSTPALAALETMRFMTTLSPNDRRKVAFVFIDIDDVLPDLVSFRRQHEGVFQDFRLHISVPAHIALATRVHQPPHGVYRGHQEQHTFIRGYVPYFANGAGGIRNNGHVAAVFHYDTLIGKLKQAIAAVTAIGTDQGAQRINEVSVHIVAFLGGGTGSGILPDIAVTMRDILLQEADLFHSLFLHCMLPEQFQGMDEVMMGWKRSNSAAALLEILALSRAPNQEPQQEYRKYMREFREIVRDVIANEVYLIGRSGVNQVDGTARIVGLTLFQHITDASGVGFVEHARYLDRRALGNRDEFNLPTFFGTICPFAVIFPAEATALAFAQISAAHVLPLLGSHLPWPVPLSDIQEAARVLNSQGARSMAWQGRLDLPHPHQRHLFDLNSLNLVSGGNDAVQKLYRWATDRDSKLANDQAPLDYTTFVAEYLAFINLNDHHGANMNSAPPHASDSTNADLATISSQLVGFFRHYYLRRFQDVNLFELLDCAMPGSTDLDQRRDRISGYLYEHLSHIKDLRRALVAFEPELSPKGTAGVLTSAYLGMHWRDGGQQAMLNTASREMNVITATSSDPHQLHVAYGSHALRLNMVREYSLSHGSAMADYLRYQDVWDRNEHLPVHASGEMERLVTEMLSNIPM